MHPTNQCRALQSTKRRVGSLLPGDTIVLAGRRTEVRGNFLSSDRRFCWIHTEQTAQVYLRTKEVEV